jgi:predicted LPLAT superfamily acyltransferase
VKSLNVSTTYLNKQRQLGDQPADNTVYQIFKKNQQTEFYKLFSLSGIIREESFYFLQDTHRLGMMKRESCEGKIFSQITPCQS